MDDNDMRRLFTDGEVGAARIRQGDVCPVCLRALSGRIVGDHIVSFERGGLTEEGNCMALHDACHPVRHRFMPSGARRWQQDCVGRWLHRRLLGAMNDPFLAVAPPGSGKTRMTAALIDYFRHQERDGFVLMISPTKQVVRNWGRELLPRGMIVQSVLAPDDVRVLCNDNTVRELVPVRGRGTIPPDAIGWTLTYAALEGALPGIMRVARQRPLLLIADEAHHAGQQLTWGNALQEAARLARESLYLTATPFRTDGLQIPGASYVNGMVAHDYRLPWLSAVEDGVITPCVFSYLDAEMGWREITESDDAEEILTRNGRISEGEYQALEAALKSDVYLHDLLRRGEDELHTVRHFYPPSTGLIVAMDQNHARHIYRMLTRMRPGCADLAISDEAESHAVVDAFRGRQRADGSWQRDSRADWLVTVRMVSEGCDIPHLKVLVWASTVKTRLMVIQTLGRVIRVVDLDGQPLTDVAARIVIPLHPIYVRFAVELTRDVADALRRRREREEGGEGDGGEFPSFPTIDPTTAEDIRIGAVVSGETRITPPLDIEEIASNTPWSASHITEVLYATGMLGEDDLDLTDEEPSTDGQPPTDGSELIHDVPTADPGGELNRDLAWIRKAISTIVIARNLEADRAERSREIAILTAQVKERCGVVGEISEATPEQRKAMRRALRPDYEPALQRLRERRNQQ